MTKRRFSHSNNPGFRCHESVILLPFGRRSYLQAAVVAYGGVEIPMDETTDRLVFDLERAPLPVTLIYSGMGSPAAANALEMAAANGARRLVLFGACGGVDREVQVGDLLVPTGAVRGEGTSRYYAPVDQPAVCDPGLTSILLDESSRLEGPRVHHGMVYTTDASYRQGPEIYDTGDERILGVECECAAAAIVGSHLGLRVAALFFCTDNITLPQKTDHPYRGLGDERVRRGFDDGLEAVMAALARPHPGS